MIHLLESDVCTYINHLEFFCIGDLSILPHLLIQLFINISMDSYIYCIRQVIFEYFFYLFGHWKLTGSSFTWLLRCFSTPPFYGGGVFQGIFLFVFKHSFAFWYIHAAGSFRTFYAPVLQPTLSSRSPGYLSARCVCCYRAVIVSEQSQLAGLRNTCIFTKLHMSIYLQIFSI